MRFTDSVSARGLNHDGTSSDWTDCFVLRVLARTACSCRSSFALDRSVLRTAPGNSTTSKKISPKPLICRKSILRNWSRITSYNVCYTKLLRVTESEKKVAGYKTNNILFGIDRITSYNVCYTKLLRIIATVGGYVLPKRSGFQQTNNHGRPQSL